MAKAKKTKSTSKKTSKAKKSPKKPKRKKVKKAKKPKKAKRPKKKKQEEEQLEPGDTIPEVKISKRFEEPESNIDELVAEGLKSIVVEWIGPPYLTKYERSRITGARALQISMSAPILAADLPFHVNKEDPISVAEFELRQKILPLAIRRRTPDGKYVDIPLREFIDRPEDRTT